jgi:hypothetical protein
LLSSSLHSDYAQTLDFVDAPWRYHFKRDGWQQS